MTWVVNEHALMLLPHFPVTEAKMGEKNEGRGEKCILLSIHFPCFLMNLSHQQRVL
jgi:hypothetical protein